MHVYFSGIGGTGIGPLALIAKQAGYEVSGSDKQDSQYIQYLKSKGINEIHIGQTQENIAQVHAKQPIDWFVYSSALPKENPEHPELIFCEQNSIKHSRRDKFLSNLINENNLKLLAVAGTHGKTTTTAMLIWLCQKADLKISYSVGAKTSFADMGHFDPDSEYFVYECDEYDRNFLAFHPYISLISGIAYDHHDIYPTEEDYRQAFRDFLNQSRWKIVWRVDSEKLGVNIDKSYLVLEDSDEALSKLKLAGEVNRRDAWEVIQAVKQISDTQTDQLIDYMNGFPGVSRRFEQITSNLYSDYAHTPEKIEGALQLAHEVAGSNVVVVYEGLHNTRQHFIKDQLKNLFNDVKQLYIVPSYLARENKDLELLTPSKLLDLLSDKAREHTTASELNNKLKNDIQQHIQNGDLVLCISAGGGNSLDEWLRKEFKT
jgi:UDP-N-acetylmuramate--alanine ligase